MFDFDLTSLITGVILGFVIVQLYPPSARIGAWIVNKVKAGITWIRER